MKPKNKTGLPDNLKSGIEKLSGMSMDDVNVHGNSPNPAQLQSHAYAQGTDIQFATGQEKYLPHEAWSVVQQKQGRVKTTIQMQDNVNLNDNDNH
ncbi:MAG: eCIS core domain-containing protein [Saprospiraceae bacterium]